MKIDSSLDLRSRCWSKKSISSTWKVYLSTLNLFRKNSTSAFVHRCLPEEATMTTRAESSIYAYQPRFSQWRLFVTSTLRIASIAGFLCSIVQESVCLTNVLSNTFPHYTMMRSTLSASPESWTNDRINDLRPPERHWHTGTGRWTINLRDLRVWFLYICPSSLPLQCFCFHFATTNSSSCRPSELRVVRFSVNGRVFDGESRCYSLRPTHIRVKP
jgi:hypothetical protein